MNKKCQKCRCDYTKGTELMCRDCVLFKKIDEVRTAIASGEICPICKSTEKHGEELVGSRRVTTMHVGGKYGKSTQRNVVRESKQRSHPSCNADTESNYVCETEAARGLVIDLFPEWVK